jgi:hypothetical protein
MNDLEKRAADASSLYRAAYADWFRVAEQISKLQQEADILRREVDARASRLEAAVKNLIDGEE